MWGGGRVGVVVQCGCERRIEVFERIHKNKFGGGSGVFGLGVFGFGVGQGGCERKIEVFVKIQNKILREGVGSGGRVGGSGWM